MLKRIKFEVPKYKMGNRDKEYQTAKASSYPQGYFKDKACRHCSTKFTPKAPSEHYCSDPCKDYAVLNNFLKRNYNITAKIYEETYIEQNGLCAICKTEGFTMKKGKDYLKLVCDHDHKTGKFRGLLCHNCNRALGLLHDSLVDIKEAYNYIERSL